MKADRFERTSPKALIPKQLIAMTKKIKIETQAAELISAFQNLSIATRRDGTMSRGTRRDGSETRLTE